MLCRYKIKYLRDDFISSNNLDAIRLLAATLVVYGHSFSISSVNGYSDILKSIGFLGSHVVGLYIFFLISGFLITLSIERKNDPVDFIKARVLRLVPGMIVSTCLTLIMVAPFSSLSITEFLASKEAVKYVVMNSSLLDMRGGGGLGVFADNRIPSVVNGSLWSISLEVKCYALLFFMWISGLLYKRIKPFSYALVVLLLVVRPEPLFSIEDGSLHQKCIGFFVAGSMACQVRKHIPINFSFFAVSFAMSTLASGILWGWLDNLLTWLAIVCFVFFAAFYLKPVKLSGDYSYGVYVYAFPIQQIAVALMPELNPYELFFISMLAVLPLAYLSWHVVEERMLQLKKAPFRSRQLLVPLALFTVIFVCGLLVIRHELSVLHVVLVLIMMRVVLLMKRGSQSADTYLAGH